MTEPVSIPISIFDVTIEFVKPNLRLAMDRANIVEELFDRFSRWGISVDDLDVIKDGKPSEQGVKFKLPGRKTTFFFGPSFARLTWDDANWETADGTMEILSIGLEALASHGQVQAGKYKASVVLHIQPKKGSFIDLLKPFGPPALYALDGSPLTAFATVLRWEARRITIDGSAQIANAIFLRFERDFPGSVSVKDMAAELLAEEKKLFSIIGVEETAQ